MDLNRNIDVTSSLPLLDIDSPAVSDVDDAKLLSEINAIPDRMAFKIGDVAKISGVKQYVLRFWEGEFDVLKPKKSTNNQRMYSRKDVETVLLIKKLLYRDKFSISGAIKAMRKAKAQVKGHKQIFTSQNRVSSALQKAFRLRDCIRGLRTEI